MSNNLLTGVATGPPTWSLPRLDGAPLILVVEENICRVRHGIRSEIMSRTEGCSLMVCFSTNAQVFPFEMSFVDLRAPSKPRWGLCNDSRVLKRGLLSGDGASRQGNQRSLLPRQAGFLAHFGYCSSQQVVEVFPLHWGLQVVFSSASLAL